MRKFFSNYGWTMVYLLTSIISVGSILALFQNQQVINSVAFENMAQATTAEIVYSGAEIPTVSTKDFVVSNIILPLNAEFDYREYINVTASNGDVLNSYVTCRELYGYNDTQGRKIDTQGNLYMADGKTVDKKLTSIPGEHDVQFILNWNGYNITKKIIVSVSENENLPITTY